MPTIPSPENGGETLEKRKKKRNSENSFDKRLTCGVLFAMINLNNRSTFGL